MYCSRPSKSTTVQSNTALALSAPWPAAASSPFLPAHHRAPPLSFLLLPFKQPAAALLPQLHLFRPQLPAYHSPALHFTPTPILRKLPPLETICPLNLIPPLFAFLLLCCNYAAALFQLETDTSITSGLACMSPPPNHLPTFFIACTLFLGLPPVQSIPLFTLSFSSEAHPCTNFISCLQKPHFLSVEIPGSPHKFFSTLSLPSIIGPLRSCTDFLLFSPKIGIFHPLLVFTDAAHFPHTHHLAGHSALPHFSVVTAFSRFLQTAFLSLSILSALCI